MKLSARHIWIVASYGFCAAALAVFYVSPFAPRQVFAVGLLLAASLVCGAVALFTAARSRSAPAILHDERGSVALTTGLILLILAVAAGFSLDFVLASRARQAQQDALDTATLVAAHEKTDADIQTRGANALLAQIKNNKSLGQQTSAFVVTTDAITSDAYATYQPVFLGLGMKGPLRLHAHTQVKRAINPLELALVLDTTGSMAGTKMTTLKLAATNLVTKLKADAASDVKIAVVPFAQYVNIGVSRRNASWMNTPADTSTPQACYLQTTTSTTSCESYACTKTSDGVPYASTCTRNCVTTTTVLVPPKTVCPSPVLKKFYGCAGSPAYPRSVQDSDPARVYPGIMDVTCAKELTPLTSTASTVTTAIAALTTTGETYIPSGLAWGFNLLSAPQPFTDAQPYDPGNKRPRKALVLMTDGENTKLLRVADGKHDVSPATGLPATQANTYTAELCQNIKAQKIELFTVAFSVTNAPTKAMLQTCATDAAHFFDASDSDALIKAFDDIAGALRDLYISQ